MTVAVLSRRNVTIPPPLPLRRWLGPAVAAANAFGVILNADSLGAGAPWIAGADVPTGTGAGCGGVGGAAHRGSVAGLPSDSIRYTSPLAMSTPYRRPLASSTKVERLATSGPSATHARR